MTVAQDTAVRERAADLRLRREYGISLADYNRVLEYQGSSCAICKRLPRRVRLSLDHDHLTGLLRGLLCQKCNRALGHYQDSAVRLQTAAEYILRPPLIEVLGRLYTAPGRVGSKKRAKELKVMGSNLTKGNDGR